MHYLMVRVANEEEKQVESKAVTPTASTGASVASTVTSSSRRPLLGSRSSLLPPRCGKPSKSKQKKPLTDQAKDVMESTIQDDWSLTVPDDLQNLYPSAPPLASTNKSSNSKRTGPSSNNKIASTDVASVGNASDTSVRVHSQTFSGRDLHETAKYHLNKKSYDKALDCFEAILQAQSQRFGPCHPSVGAALHNVGVCRQRMQQHDLAANLFQEAVQIRKQTASQLEVAASLAKLGLAQASLGNSEQAFCSLRQALAISKQELGSHKTTAQMLCHLGCFYFETGELFAAQATFQDAYDMYQQVWHHQSSDQQACLAQMVDTLCNIGSIQNRRKRYNDGIATFQQALELISDESKKVATLDNLAYSYSKIKDYANALACYQKMLKLQSKAPAFSEECFETFRKLVLMHEKLKTSPWETIQETLLLAQSKECSEKVESQIKAMLDKRRVL
jgi:tetratricopeptide (TPR) repeat protein